MSEGILKQVYHSEWTTPTVIVPKSNGSAKIRGDHRTTVNADTEND